MSAYTEAIAALKKLASTNLRDRKAYVEHIKGLVVTLEKVAEDYEEVGQGKMSTRTMAVRNKMLTLSRRLEKNQLSSISEVKQAAEENLATMATLSPKTADVQHEKAGIKDQAKLFSGFNAKRVKLSTDSDTAAFKLERAPLLLLFKNKITPTQAKLLKSFGSTFYQGTNGVAVPAVPILVLNKKVVAEKDYEKQIKAVLKGLKRTDLAVFTGEAVSRRGYIAFPVFEPRDAEVMSVIFFDALQSKELLVS